MVLAAFFKQSMIEQLAFNLGAYNLVPMPVTSFNLLARSSNLTTQQRQIKTLQNLTVKVNNGNEKFGSFQKCDASRLFCFLVSKNFRFRTNFYI